MLFCLLASATTGTIGKTVPIAVAVRADRIVGNTHMMEGAGPMERFRFGVIGAGRRAGEFADGLKELNEHAELLAVADANPERLAAYDRLKGPFKRTFTDWRELLALEEVDVVIVCTPDFTHEEIAVACFEAGKHVLCEKPLGINVKQAWRILQASRRAGKLLEVGFTLRYAPLFARLREVIREDATGPLWNVWMGDYNSQGGGYFRRWNRFYEKSGGLLVHKGCHSFDLLNWYLEDEPVEVVAYGGNDVYVSDPEKGRRCSTCENRCPEYFDMNEDEYERALFTTPEKVDGYQFDVCKFNSEKTSFDNSVVIIQYRRGAKVTYNECFFCSPHSGRTLRMCGPLAEIRAYEIERRIEILSRHNTDREIIDVAAPAYEQGHGGGDRRQLASLLSCLRENRPTLAGGEAGLWAVAIGEAAEISAREGRPVRVEELLCDAGVELTGTEQGALHT